MNRSGTPPAMVPFDLGPEGFVIRGQFVLAEGDWRTALGYCNSVLATRMEDISFGDVRLYFGNLQASAHAWIDRDYSTEIIPLANAVVHYATRVAVHYPALVRVLTALRSDADSSTSLQQVDAILEMLSQTPREQAASAREAATVAERFVGGVATGEAKLRVLFDDYARIYLRRGCRERDVILPEALDGPVAALGRAWARLAEELGRLKRVVQANVTSGNPFQVEIAESSAVALWKTTGDAADHWRREALIG